MSHWNGYFYIENLGLNTAQRDTLIAQLRSMGLLNDSPYPNERNHWRTRLDGQAAIFEAVFDADQLTATAVRNRLAGIFSVLPEAITFTTVQTEYGPAVTYTHSSLQRLRLGIFGGLAETLLSSRAAATAFVMANLSAWEIIEVIP